MRLGFGISAGIVAVLSALFCACTTRTPEFGDALFPKQGFAPGWAAASPVKTFTRDNLYDHIDGEAELYYPYGFLRVASLTYVNGENTIVADVYEMGSSLDAFGIYSNYRYEGADSVQIGTESFAGESQLMFYQGRFFTRLTVLGDPEETREPLLACAQAIQRSLPGPSDPPVELKLLDIEGVNLSPARYVAESLLGYAFFKRGLIAETRAYPGRVRVLIVLGESEAESGQALELYRAYLEESGATHTGEGRQLLARDPLYKGVWVEQVGPYLLGAVQLDEPEDGAELIQQLKGRVQACRAAE